MKLSKIAITLFGATLLFSSGAFANDANKGTLKLAEKVTVDGKSLNPGKYTVEWDGSGSSVQVTILQGKQAVATFPAHVTEQSSANLQDAYGSATEPDGSKSLTAIYPGGKRLVLEIDQKSASQQSSTQSAK